MKKTSLQLLTVLTVWAVFVMCNNSFEVPHVQETLSAEGTGRVVIRIAGTELRTFLPDIGQLSYNLTIIPTGASTPVVDETFDNSGFNWLGELYNGEYSVAVIGYISEITHPALIGTNTLTVTAGETNSIAVALNAISSGTGTLAYQINITDAVQFNYGKLLIVSVTEETASQQVNLTVNTMSGNIILQSGCYKIFIELTGIVDTQERIYRTTAVVYIDVALATQAVYELTEDDFFYNVFSVCFDSTGESVIFPQTVLSGGTASRPANPTRSGYVFDNWYIDSALTVVYDFSTPVINDVTLYAKWINLTVTNTSEWNAVLTVISNSGNNQNYTVYISGDIGVAGNTATTFGAVIGLSVTLKGSGRLYLTSQGNMIRLAANQTLIIDSADLTLQGLKNGQNEATQDNNTSMVYINAATAQLELRNGTITGNTATATTTVSCGGGVYVAGGSFIMDDGEISGNTASTSGDNNHSYGGGVYVNGGSFIMNGGKISDNVSTAPRAYSHGGGVFITGSGSSFTMHDGEISGNTSLSPLAMNYYRTHGGGVEVFDYGTFTMNGGKISGNNTTYNGGPSSGTYGGGVYVGTNGIFAMNDGEISGNTAYSGSGTSYGGGVYVDAGTFRIVTGTIYGSGEGAMSNLAISGASLYIQSGTAQRGTFSGDTWNNAGDLSTTINTIMVIDGVLMNIADITAPIWHEGVAVSLTVPPVTFPAGQTITVQGWQLSDTGIGGWTTVTPPTAADISLSGKYLRYYAVCSGGFTLYSNQVIIIVFGANNTVTVTDTTGWNTVKAIISGGGNNQTYTINVNGNIGVAGSTANTFGTATGITVTLQGSGRLNLTSTGYMIRLAANQTLIIDSANLTLQGRSDNNKPLVFVTGSNSKLELRNGTISGNSNSTVSTGGNSNNTSLGGGVYVYYGGTFTMSGGKISGNTAVNGGGVFVSGIDGSGGTATTTFNMIGGEISGNSASGGAGVNVSSYGIFRIVTGTVYGSNEGALSNSTTYNNSGAALVAGSGGTSQRGTFSGSTWNSLGNLSTTDNTIRVANGVLQ